VILICNGESIDFNEDSNYRWPYGLLIRRAWKFDEPLQLFEGISRRQFSMDAASGIVPLTDDEAARFLSYRERKWRP
jgi:hypothetical protein